MKIELFVVFERTGNGCQMNKHQENHSGCGLSCYLMIETILSETSHFGGVLGW